MQIQLSFWKKTAIICLLFTTFINVRVFADAPPTPLTVEISQYYPLDTGGTITKVAIADPAIADIAIITSNKIVIVAKKVGSTTLLIKTSDGMQQNFSVNVTANNSALVTAIKNVLGNNVNIYAQKSGDNILLRGTVKNQYERDTAEKIANLYGSKVVNMIQMSAPSQVRIEAQIVEISANNERDLGFLYSNPSSITVNSNGSTTVTMGTTGSFSIGQSFNRSYADLNATLQALEQKGLAKILSKPNITTLSGEKASILIGGKIPIPTSNNNGDISIEWRDYGIKLDIDPIVDNSNNITAKIKAEVSTLDYAHQLKNNNFLIPALASREASTDVTVKSGGTMAIGGLLNSEESKTITKVPLLGDIPIIGEFFKHSAKTRDKRELIILITPVLVDQNTPVNMTQDLENLYKDKQIDQRRETVITEGSAINKHTDDALSGQSHTSETDEPSSVQPKTSDKPANIKLSGILNKPVTAQIK
ncbi:type II and III secretion system protein family protein [Pectinatus frisingensis]|uniref:type II and III secretion system protein family protein n=1 Tax=Pectinatus frisingensis TaxID=865 RepID=UPI0018C6A4EB|nr:pilus assembly protein N-terminal domain-containing protein [Pectinatus frisingensis]